MTTVQRFLLEWSHVKSLAAVKMQTFIHFTGHRNATGVSAIITILVILQKSKMSTLTINKPSVTAKALLSPPLSNISTHFDFR